MSFSNRVFLPVVALCSLAFLVACGSSGNSATPPPGGSFSNKNLNGTYVFSVTGSDPNGAFQTIAGTFVADGNGDIKSGTMEVNNAESPNLLPATAITGGGYDVGVDGRGGLSKGGGLTLQTSAGSLTFDFALMSSEHGLITEYDGNGTGSGTLDIQPSAVSQSNINGQSYAFNFSGIGTLNPTTGAETSFATVGAFTLDTNGNITNASVADLNNAGSSSGLTDLQLSGTVSLAAVPGTATLTTSAATLHFDVYPVDATHLEFIETDGAPIMAGDAFTQSSSISSGNYVFTLAGFDSTLQGPFTAAGIFDMDGSGNILSSSVEDINDFGTVKEVTGTSNFGTYSPVTNGRATITLTSAFINGNGGVVACTDCVFAAYPFTGGLQLLEIDSGGMTGGVAYTQNATTLATSSQGYAYNLSGAILGTSGEQGEEDDIAEFVNSSGTFTGRIDVNDDIFGTGESLGLAKSFSATYTADTTVPGRATLTATSGNSTTPDLVTYVVDNSTVVGVEVDTTQPGLASFSPQNSSSNSNAAIRNLNVTRLIAGVHKASKLR